MESFTSRDAFDAAYSAAKTGLLGLLSFAARAFGFCLSDKVRGRPFFSNHRASPFHGAYHWGTGSREVMYLVLSVCWELRGVYPNRAPKEMLRGRYFWPVIAVLTSKSSRQPPWNPFAPYLPIPSAYIPNAKLWQFLVSHFLRVANITWPVLLLEFTPRSDLHLACSARMIYLPSALRLRNGLTCRGVTHLRKPSETSMRCPVIAY